MIPINQDAILSLKNYVDKRELRLKELYYDKKYRFFSLEFFNVDSIAKIIDMEYKKGVTKSINNMLLLYFRVQDTNFIIGGENDIELRKNFISFLVAY